MKKQTSRLFTHTDLDGMGCAVMYMATGGKLPDIRFCGYEEVNQQVIDALKNPDLEKIYISDTSVNEEVAHLLDIENKKGNIEIILRDHHHTAAWLNRYTWAKVDSSKCATWWMYEELTPGEAWLPFATMVNNYDLWENGNPSPEARNLNRLVSLMGFSAFCRRFAKNPDINLLESEKLRLNDDKKRQDRYFKKVNLNLQIFDIGDLRLGVAFADDYVSDLANWLIIQNSLNCVALIDIYGTEKGPKVSLRSLPGVDVSLIATAMGGGGHRLAAGYQDGEGVERIREALAGIKGLIAQDVVTGLNQEVLAH